MHAVVKFYQSSRLLLPGYPVAIINLVHADRYVRRMTEAAAESEAWLHLAGAYLPLPRYDVMVGMLVGVFIAVVVMFWVHGADMLRILGIVDAVPPPEPKEPGWPPPKPEKPLRLTATQLLRYDGKHRDATTGHRLPIYIAIRDNVYDVSGRGDEFYGEHAPYELFAGRDATRAMAKQSLEPEDVDAELARSKGLPPPHDFETGLGWFERDQLEGWEQTFHWKYDVVGKLIKEATVGDANNNAVEEENGTAVLHA